MIKTDPDLLQHSIGLSGPEQLGVSTFKAEGAPVGTASGGYDREKGSGRIEGQTVVRNRIGGKIGGKNNASPLANKGLAGRLLSWDATPLPK